MVIIVGKSRKGGDFYHVTGLKEDWPEGGRANGDLENHDKLLQSPKYVARLDNNDARERRLGSFDGRCAVEALSVSRSKDINNCNKGALSSERASTILGETSGFSSR
jgi:hypothetical protein